jgi:putative phage-type endonuclease
MDKRDQIKNIKYYETYITEHDIKNIEDIHEKINNEINKDHLLKVCEKIINSVQCDSNKKYDIYDDGELLSSKTIAVLIKEYDDDEFNEMEENFNKIRSIKSPDQRSPEWFELRKMGITASDGGCALGLNKYEPQYKFIYNKIFGKPFETGEACYWGKKYETAVALTYSLLNNCIVEDFGILTHPKYDFIKASPDGIVRPYRQDGTKSHIPSRMLEIKCVVTRTLNFDGDIYDFICPKYYHIQTALQMQVTNISECDFAQYKIEEYNNKEEWLEDTHPEFYYKSKKYGIERGVLIEILPRDLKENDYVSGYIKLQTVYDKAVSIYPPKIDLTPEELDIWVETETERLKEDKEFMINKIFYYRIIDRNCTLIVKNDLWFENNLDTLEKIWKNVEYLRSNPPKASDWQTFINKQSRKMNNTIMKKLEEITGINIKNK